MLQQLYWTLWGASSAQKEQQRPEPKGWSRLKRR